MAADLTFQQFTPGGETQVGDQLVGLRNSDLTQNFKFDFPGVGVRDANGNIMLQWATTGISATNWPKVINSLPGNAVQYTAEGNDANIGIEIRPKGTGGLKLDDINWPLSPGSVGSFMYMANATDIGFTSTPVVTSVSGTENQVLVDGTFGVPQGGSVTLTTPQDIGTTSSPTFAALTLTAPLTLLNGGTSKALTASNGGIVYTDSDSMEILSGTPTAGQLLLSGSSSAPSWTTTTYPATNPASTFLYASSANIMSSLPTANNGTIVTSSTGIPSVLAGPGVSGRALISQAASSPIFSTGQVITQVISRIFTANGTYTPTVGMIFCITEVVGAGAGSGGAATSGAVNAAVGGSGGAGGYSREILTAATIGVSQAVTIGTGGTAGAAGNNAGGNGGTTSLGALISATGGNAGAGGASTSSGSYAGGVGGVGSGGNFNTNGNPGSPGLSSSTLVMGGNGGSSFFGGGGQGRVTAGAGNAATSYGGGASGGITANSAQQPGATGFQGIIIITEFISV